MFVLYKIYVEGITLKYLFHISWRTSIGLGREDEWEGKGREERGGDKVDLFD